MDGMPSLKIPTVLPAVFQGKTSMLTDETSLLEGAVFCCQMVPWNFVRIIQWISIKIHLPTGSRGQEKIYLHLVDFCDRCRYIYHTWILWAYTS